MLGEWRRGEGGFDETVGKLERLLVRKATLCFTHVRGGAARKGSDGVMVDNAEMERVAESCRAVERRIERGGR